MNFIDIPFDLQSKDSIAIEAIREGVTVAELSREYGIK